MHKNELKGKKTKSNKRLAWKLHHRCEKQADAGHQLIRKMGKEED